MNSSGRKGPALAGEISFACSVDEVTRRLEVNLKQGLTAAKIPHLRKRFGFNELAQVEKSSPWRDLWRHFNELVVWLLVAAAILSGFLGDWTDATVIIVVVLLNGLMGFLQERKAQLAFAALEKLSAPNAKVIRDGLPLVIPARELLPGDIIELAEGDFVPADARLTQSFELRAQESALTGESVPVEKDASATLETSTPLADQKNMVFSGTAVTSGSATAIVVATGMITELGQIAEMLQTGGPQVTPLQDRINKLGKTLVVACLGLIALISGLHLIRGGNFFEVFLLSVSMAVAAVPEGLPAVVTVALAIGLRRMAKKKALIRRLPSVETLGSVSVICTDKTGTLTRNEMMVRWVYAGGKLFHVTGNGYEPEGLFHKATENHLNVSDSLGEVISVALVPDLKHALTIGVRCNRARLLRPNEHDKPWQLAGDPTDGALLVAGLKAGIEVEEPGSQLLKEIPFESHRKFMSVLLRTSDKKIRLYTKGALEVILPKCKTERIDGSSQTLNGSRRNQIVELSEQLGSRGLRVLALASQEMETPSLPTSNDNLVFAGFVGIMDPPRGNAREAVERCLRAGIKPVMITGDHPSTAAAVAKELGISKGNGRVVSGVELDALLPSEFERQVEDIAVYARVTAEHKLKIVKAWKKCGALVAMTGDGVNDAPAIQEADIGIAMGISGTDVTKQASDLVLLDDNFSTIITAVEEGRRILENIKKVLQYLLAGNTGELLVMFGATVIGFPYPLLPTQFLWINLVTDALPALALSVDPVHSEVMRRPPHPVTQPILSWRRGSRIVLQGGLIAGSVLLAFGLTYRNDPASLKAARIVAFGTLAFSHILFSLSCRNNSRSLFSIGIFSNPWLLGAVAISASMQLAVMWLPIVREWFDVTVLLSKEEWIRILGFALLPLGLLEFRKIIWMQWQRRTQFHPHKSLKATSKSKEGPFSDH